MLKLRKYAGRGKLVSLGFVMNHFKPMFLCFTLHRLILDYILLMQCCVIYYDYQMENTLVSALEKNTLEIHFSKFIFYYLSKSQNGGVGYL